MLSGRSIQAAVRLLIRRRTLYPAEVRDQGRAALRGMRSAADRTRGIIAQRRGILKSGAGHFPDFVLRPPLRRMCLHGSGFMWIVNGSILPRNGLPGKIGAWGKDSPSAPGQRHGDAALGKGDGRGSRAGRSWARGRGGLSASRSGTRSRTQPAAGR